MLFPPAVAAITNPPAIAQPHRKELQLQITKEIIIITVMPIVNALLVAHHTMMDIARNADIPISIRVGWESNINITNPNIRIQIKLMYSAS